MEPTTLSLSAAALLVALQSGRFFFLAHHTRDERERERETEIERERERERETERERESEMDQPVGNRAPS
jgi:uncharacterized protein HemX